MQAIGLRLQLGPLHCVAFWCEGSDLGAQHQVLASISRCLLLGGNVDSVQRFFVPEKLGIQNFIWGGIHFKHLLQNLSTARDRFLGQLQTLSCHMWPLTFWVCSHSWLGPGIEFHADKIVQKTEPLHSNTEYLCHVIFCFQLPHGQPALVCNSSKSQASP